MALPVACGEPDSASARESLAAAADAELRLEPLSDFELTTHTGAPITRASLRGRPVVLDFIFTTCTGPCPVVSGSMRELAASLRDTPVRLLSISVDPEYDTPEVLAAYAQRFEADAERWWFATGAEEEVERVLRSLWLARAKDPAAPLGMQVTHSTRLVVLDGAGVVRGHYDGESEAGWRAAAARARWLSEHPGR